jgi:hypothetical protein
LHVNTFEEESTLEEFNFYIFPFAILKKLLAVRELSILLKLISENVIREASPNTFYSSIFTTLIFSVIYGSPLVPS